MKQIALQEEEERKERESEAIKSRYVALKAQKAAQGLAVVEVGTIITLLDLTSKEVSKCYLASDTVTHETYGDVYVEKYATPPGDADFYAHANTAFGFALNGKFVNDEIEVLAPGGKFIYRILAVTPCPAQSRETRAALRLPEQNISEAPAKMDIAGEAYCFAAREDGQYGSFPKHDDYGDESNAEVRDYDERFGPSLTQPEQE